MLTHVGGVGGVRAGVVCAFTCALTSVGVNRVSWDLVLLLSSHPSLLLLTCCGRGGADFCQYCSEIGRVFLDVQGGLFPVHHPAEKAV